MMAVVCIISFIFYAPSITNEYALDDGIVMEKNEYVHQGFSGINDILTKDAFSSFFKQLNSKGQLSGGRYRPLSIVTFAIEYELFGFKAGDKIHTTGNDGKVYEGKIKKINPSGEIIYTTKEFGEGSSQLTMIHEFKALAHTQHFMNVLLYAVSMVVLFYFLSNILLKEWTHKEYWAMFITLIFAMHPIHSEVVANIKSRDEIMSFLFIILTLTQCGIYLKNKKIQPLVLTGVFMFLAMLSKEYAAILIVIVPFWLWASSEKTDLKTFVLPSAVMAVVLLIYFFGLRKNAVMIGDPGKVKDDVLNNYYLFAKGDEKIATQVYILLKYFLLQIFPYPLSSDYSYSSIPYRHFSSPSVIISIILHLGIIGLGIYGFIKKNSILIFSVGFYVLNLVLVTNFIFNIGASMGERLVYNASLGLIILVFYAIYLFIKRSGKKSIYVGIGVVGILAIPFLPVVWARCAAWKNDFTLAMTDVKTNPNSALLNANAGTYLFNRAGLPENKDKEKEMLLESRGYILKALEIHPEMANGWMNLTLIEYRLKNYDAAEAAVSNAYRIFPSNPQITQLQNLVANEFINTGFEKYKQGKPDSCFYYLYRAKKVAPFNPECYYNLGGAYLTVAKNTDSAIYYFKKTLEINPNDQRALQGLNSMGLTVTR